MEPIDIGLVVSGGLLVMVVSVPYAHVTLPTRQRG